MEALLLVLGTVDLGRARVFLGVIVILTLYVVIGLWTWQAEVSYLRQYREAHGQPQRQEWWWPYLYAPSESRAFAQIAYEQQSDMALERARRRAVWMRYVRWALIPLTLVLVVALANCNASPL